MNRRRYIGYRVLWAALASFIVTVVLFALAHSLGDLTQSPQAQNAFGQTEQFWDESDPFVVQYVDWMQSLLTLDLGHSQRFDEPVASLLLERAPITLAYLTPAVLLGTAMSTVFGYVAARKRGEWSDRFIRGCTYVVLAIPNFVVGALLVRYFRERVFEWDGRLYDIDAGFFFEWNLFWILIATLILGTHVAAVQIRQVRTQSSEYLETDFSRLLQAKGVGRRRFARHVLRASAVPLTSLFVAEVVGLLLVSIFVLEAILAIPGLGQMAWYAVVVNDSPVVLTVTILVAFTILLASLLEDIVAVVFDPRIAAEE